MKSFRILLAALAVLGLATTAQAEDKFITVASTTSTQNSGLFKYLLPKFTKKSGIDVHVVAVGTGAAIRLAKKGDADVLLVHHKPSELAFVAAGYGVKRYELMYNDFVLIGPKNDPAGAGKGKSIQEAFNRVRDAKQVFVSRADDSGTDKRERGIWKLTGQSPDGKTDSWYREIGAGMGAALNMAAAMQAYTLSDRGTWLSFKNRRDETIVYQGDPMLRNVYGVTLVSPKKFPHVKVKEGQEFIDWLLSAEGQKDIAAYQINGKVLFHPLAMKQ